VLFLSIFQKYDPILAAIIARRYDHVSARMSCFIIFASITCKRKGDAMAGFLNRRLHLFNVVVWLIVCCTAGFAFCARGFSAPVTEKEAAALSTREKQALVQQAVADYEQGVSAKAQEGLERAQTVFPENYAVPYYLGLIYLEQKKRAAAIAQWQRYVKMAPESDNALKIRKYLTKLLREQARESAKQAVAMEAALASGRADDKTVAVTAFKNLGSDQLASLGKGMAAMLISDLSQVPDLHVVERIRLQALLEEMKLGTSGLVDKKTAPKVGKLLKAKHVTTGSLSDLESLDLMIASVVMDTDKSDILGTQQTQGAMMQFYDLEKQIACQIIEDFGKDCSQVPAAFNTIHTTSMPALVSYSKGLEYFDQEQYDKARAMFQQALKIDPLFKLAEEELMATPTMAIFSMDSSQIVSQAASQRSIAPRGGNRSDRHVFQRHGRGRCGSGIRGHRWVCADHGADRRSCRRRRRSGTGRRWRQQWRRRHSI
jgi:tetratricopeptide (TPR) repeat protein